jgi:hypothetical protein
MMRCAARMFAIPKLELVPLLHSDTLLPMRDGLHQTRVHAEDQSGAHMRSSTQSTLWYSMAHFCTTKRSAGEAAMCFHIGRSELKHSICRPLHPTNHRPLKREPGSRSRPRMPRHVSSKHSVPALSRSATAALHGLGGGSGGQAPMFLCL